MILNKISIFPFVLLLILGLFTPKVASAQQDSQKTTIDTILIDNSDALDAVDYGDKAFYEIGQVIVIGAENRDRNAIKSIAGLKEGDKIQIPSMATAKAVKALLKLRLFEDVQIVQDKLEDNVVNLRIILKERPTLSRYSYTGVKKSKHDDLNDIVRDIITKGGIVTEDQKELAAKKIGEFFVEQGKLDTDVQVKEISDESKANSVRLEFVIDTKERVKVEDIVFEGNHAISDRKLRKKMGNTKRKGTWFRKTKFIKSQYEEDKQDIIAHYNSKGFRDAEIVKDSLWRTEEGHLMIKIDVNEGKPYFFRDIKWKGNSLYANEQLTNVLGIARGDAYNPELLENRLRFSLDGRDISSLYLDDGYLFFDIQPVEVAVENDSIDIEMRIYEGPQATIENVTIAGNDRTHEHVIRREIRTRPGQKFSRSDIIRSQREIINLGYFNPENMDIQTPVNPQRGTVDVKYVLEERPSDQLELSAGYGGFSGLIGTLGVTFNNFSLRNIKDKSSWAPLPQGDGQKLSLRLQSNSRFFKSYNFSFTEPWLGGKKRNSFTVGAVHSAFDYSTLGIGALKITRGFVGLGSQLSWPDDFFGSNTTLNLELINLDNYDRGGFFVEDNNQLVPIKNGKFKNFSIKQTITRSSVSDPLFPRRGSRISLSVQLTPPYSLFRGDNFYNLSDAEKEEIARRLFEERGPADPPTTDDLEDEYTSELNSRRFEWLEYHKWRFESEWYFNIVDKLVLATKFKFGLLGAYNDNIGISPFERFELGGDGISNQSSGITGKDIVSLRGYEVTDLPANNRGGAAIFDKLTIELRYPLSLNPNSTIYLTTFLQGGNSWNNFGEFNPFEMNRSAGFGMRVFLPMFGLLGFDYGWGFDRNLGPGASAGDYAKFNIILGFEPE